MPARAAVQPAAARGPRIGAAHDPAEHEADRLAAAMTARPAPASLGCTACAADPLPCPACAAGARSLRRSALGPALPRAPSGIARAFSAGGTPLPAATRRKFEHRLGTDLSAVRLHHGAEAAFAARSVQARAFALGQDIAFGASAPALHSAAGEALLAHEVAHVALGHAGLRRQLGPLALPSDMKDEALAAEATRCTGEIARRTEGDTLRSAYEDRLREVEQERARRGGLFDSASTPGSGANAGFQVEMIDPAVFEQAVGLPVSALPEGTIVSGQSLAEARDNAPPSISSLLRGLAASGMQVPRFDPVMPGETFVQWTQFGAGHMSEGARTSSSRGQFGFRGSLIDHALGVKLDPGLLNRGVKGGFRNDWMFEFMPNQTIVARQAGEGGAASFLTQLQQAHAEGRYSDQAYRFPPMQQPPAGKGGLMTIEAMRALGIDIASPVPASCPGGNCITMPKGEIGGALGTDPVLRPGGPDPVDVRSAGGPKGGPYTPEQAGRGATVREWLGDLEARQQGPDAVPGLRVSRVSNLDLYGVRFLRTGGTVLMIYGAYRSAQRIMHAQGTPQATRVVLEESGAWVGGILGAALGTAGATALAGGVICSPTGPVTFACAAIGAAGGFVVGGVGAAVGGYLAPAALDAAESLYVKGIESWSGSMMQSENPEVRADGAAVYRAFIYDDMNAWMHLLYR